MPRFSKTALAALIPFNPRLPGQPAGHLPRPRRSAQDPHFRQDYSHADDIINTVRKEFCEGNAFCKKVTYRAAQDRILPDGTVDRGEDSKSILAQFRNGYQPHNRHGRPENWHEIENPEGRWRKYSVEQMLTRDKTGLDIFLVEGQPAGAG